MLPTAEFRVGQLSVLPVRSVCVLGINIDANLSMRTHVLSTVRACFATLHQIHNVRPSLPRHALLSLVHALVVSNMDYYNSVLTRVTGNLLYRLQSVLNSAGRLVFLARKFDRITLLLRELHWLKVPERIQYRLCVLAYRCLHNTVPSYLSESLQLAADVDGRRRLRAASSVTLVIPATRRSTLGDRVFPVAAVQAWNALPLDVKAAPSLAAFRQRRKLPLFHASFPGD